jgi:hypothetical protein
VRVAADASVRAKVWLYATAVSMLLVAVLLFAAAMASVHSVDRNHVNCGSMVKPLDVEVDGPPGTNPRPCRGAHAGDVGIALVCLAASGLVFVVVVRSRPGQRGERTNEATTNA